MRERYFFDKRDMKHFLTKYGIMMLIAIPILIVINVLFEKWFEIESMVFLNIVFLCVIFTVGEFICFMWKKRKENKESDKENN
jgi:heme/copper-type cytochrome/quinol oxidase subunit 4